MQGLTVVRNGGKNDMADYFSKKYIAITQVYFYGIKGNSQIWHVKRSLLYYIKKGLNGFVEHLKNTRFQERTNQVKKMFSKSLRIMDLT